LPAALSLLYFGGGLFCFSDCQCGEEGKRYCGVSVDRVMWVKGYFQGDMLQGVKGDGGRLVQVKSNCFRSEENLSTASVTIAKLVGAAFQNRSALLDLWVYDRGKAKMAGFFLFSFPNFCQGRYRRKKVSDSILSTCTGTSQRDRTDYSLRACPFVRALSNFSDKA